MSPTFSTVAVGQGDSQKIEEPEVSAKWCLHWQTRSAFLPHGRQRPLPRVTKAQQKCHTAPENGTVDLAFSITIFLTEICRLSMESNFFFLLSVEFSDVLFVEQLGSCSDGRPWVSALASVVSNCLPCIVIIWLFCIVVMSAPLSKWTPGIVCDSCVPMAGQNVSHVSELCKHSFPEYFKTPVLRVFWVVDLSTQMDEKNKLPESLTGIYII